MKRWIDPPRLVMTLILVPVLALCSDSAAQSPGSNKSTKPISDTDGGKGGNPFADFDSLMELIQTTVDPTTWEELGGTGTMAPYPQGVLVDPSKTLADASVSEGRSGKIGLGNPAEFANRQPTRLTPNPTTKGDELAWLKPSSLRLVSLKRLCDLRATYDTRGETPPEAFACLAGLSDVSFVCLCVEDDILLAGPVGGVIHDGNWFRDARSGRSTMRLEFLQACFASVINQTPFGCTIDPETDGIKAAMSVAQKINEGSIAHDDSERALREALAMQRVEVFGIPSETMTGYLMVKADRHMKELALGKHPLPKNANDYFDAIEDRISHGIPDNLLLRLWFTAAERRFRFDPGQTVFHLSGTAIRLSAENERAQASGQRGFVTIEPASGDFVNSFNRHWNEISSGYTFYSALESIFQSASIAEVARRFARREPQRGLMQRLGNLPLEPWVLAVPEQVESITASRQIRDGRLLHRVMIASGGVLVDPRQTLAKASSSTAQQSARRFQMQLPSPENQWWWDLPVE